MAREVEGKTKAEVSEKPGKESTHISSKEWDGAHCCRGHIKSSSCIVYWVSQQMPLLALSE